MTTPLGEKIKALIKSGGPISVTDYFALCLADPEHGYYKTREPFGREGDFTTAPEISQLFGEMVGVFMVQAWHAMNKPPRFNLAEIGPGRGTMMSDMLRVIEKLSPDMFDAASVHLVETSPRLRRIQAETLAPKVDKIEWHDGFDGIPDGPLLLAANELFDAIPIRQFVKTETGFRERMVGLDSDDALTFTPGIAKLDPALLPGPAANQPIGTILEIAPARCAVMQAICQHLMLHGGVALAIDYGYVESGFGDTLQALHAHAFDPPLARPGLADLTSHVNFEELLLTAAKTGIHVNGLTEQGDFLIGMGIAERAEALGRGQDQQTQDTLRSALERLAGQADGQMGSLFKVMAVSHPPMALAPFVPPANS
ncbi:class I SAM-dependent methyltransferase [Rhizobium sp. L1K21]|uniref:class I SAM-dependent methyltransferase n=1 Tax=Rhizobium sp. L1K21 TaxID=2954933 RepID=UPI0020924CEB|nr:class I SAM-dependent methyltransferase [Rhizobium sp. L1K21]MCO6185472.1 class I SAM-dependent methyltransferase [Rhizobium sp. L1K21]